MKKDGFTLMELLVTMLVLAIVVTITIPVFARWLPNYRLRASVRDLYSNLQLAKITAIRKSMNCTMTFNQAIGAENYDYAVYLDADNDLRYDADATTDGVDNDEDGVADEAGESEKVLTMVSFADRYDGVSFDTTQGGGDGITFTTNGDGLPSLAFRSNGIPIMPGSGIGNGTVFLINTKNTTMSVVVSRMGNIRIQ
ncbi:MAG: prepilin-type N-terminal cleavage/methylation domain-containing protein [Deltaproteobacteria bacterium]|nr:prepilin-type N-terminal cleavage/methylation domain-containing protein [Deltaproteobacteria bacterium]MBW2079015.1 prepilin-type N-terminal cleavage/methylation domain-containing protein [Deltaproteobacteria bacterium]